MSSELLNDLCDDLPSRRGVLFVMVKAYLDRGAKPDSGGIMCVAAALFRPAPYKQFCRAWKPFLRRWQAPVFHATDFYTGGGDFKRKKADGSIDPARKALFDEDSQRLPLLIGDHVHQMCLVSFREQEFEAVAPPTWRAVFGDLNGVAAQMLAGSIGHWANGCGYAGKVAYVIEDGDDGVEMDAALKRLYANQKNRDHTRMAAHPIVVPKGAARGLEAADFIAWHWNKYYADTVDPIGKPRRMRKDLRAFLDHSSQDKVHIFLFVGKELENFLLAHGCTRRAGYL